MMPKHVACVCESPPMKARYGALFAKNTLGGAKQARTVLLSFEREMPRKATRNLSNSPSTACLRCFSRVDSARIDFDPGRFLRTFFHTSTLGGHTRTSAPWGLYWSKLSPFHNGQPSDALSHRCLSLVSSSSRTGKHRHRPADPCAKADPSGKADPTRSLARSRPHPVIGAGVSSSPRRTGSGPTGSPVKMTGPPTIRRNQPSPLEPLYWHRREPVVRPPQARHRIAGACQTSESPINQKSIRRAEMDLNSHSRNPSDPWLTNAARGNTTPINPSVRPRVR